MSSLKEYLKRYESNNKEDKKKKKKKKQKTKPEALGVLVVDEDPVWQKPVNLEEEEEENDKDEETPQVDEDIEVKRMRRLEELRVRRPYNAISEDGSGWVSLSTNDSNLNYSNSDMSPPRKRRARNDTPSPDRELKSSGGENTDLSPSQQRRRRYHTPSPENDTGPNDSTGPSSHLSPPRKLRARNDEPSPGSRLESMDLSPPRQQVRRPRTSSPEPDTKAAHPSGLDLDISPPRRPRHATDVPDISPPRWGRRGSPYQDDLHASPGQDLSPPRKSRRDVERFGSPDLSSRHSQRRVALVSDLSPPRKNRKEVSVSNPMKEEQKTGLISGRDIREEITKSKKEDLMRYTFQIFYIKIITCWQTTYIINDLV